MSHQQLDRESNRVGCALALFGVGRGDIIVIRLPRGLEAVTAMIGVLKAGAAICVVEESYPQDRVNFIIHDTKAKAIIDANWMKALPESAAAVSFPEPQPDDPAIVVYTSGSTGNPKGVVNPHRALSMAVRSSVLIRTAQDIFLSAASFSFIAVALEIFAPLALGGTIHIAGDNLRRDAQALTDYVCQHGITTAFFPPQMARIVLPQLEDQLVSMVVASERVVNLYSNKVRIFNLYGCSETCSTLTCFEIDRSYPEGTPIGKPCAGSRVYILDDEGNLLPDGQEGEICVSGQIASGYLNLPELTAERFVPNPFAQNEDDKILFKTNDIGRINENGQLEYVQRKDWMVKVRGYRVEPGEIETAIVRSTPAEQAVVKGFTNALGETSLFGVYTAKEPLAPETVISAISGFLPSYMIPSFLQQLDKLPANLNGKVDRKNILPPDIAKFKAPYQSPETDRERAVCEAFQRVLGLERVGILDDFNLIGGDSISAAKVQAELSDFGIATSDILNLGTPQKLAALKLTSRLQKAAPREIWPLTFAERQMATVQGMNPESVAYNINSLALRIEGNFDTDRLEAALNALVKRHAVLRSYYPMANGEYEHRIAEDMHIAVTRRSCSADEVQQLIEEENRPFDLANAPLLRCQVFEHGINQYTLHFCIHHIIIDGTSWPFFEDELFKLYRGEELSPLAFDHQDYAVWQAEHADLRVQEAVFKEMFADGVPENEMPTHASRPEILPHADEDILRVVPKQKIRESAKRLGVTQYGLLMSVLGMTLGKYCASEDIVIGTAMSGRTMEEQDGMIGMFVNTLPIRMKPAGDMCLKDYAIQTAQTIRTVKASQTYPFEHLVPLLAPDRNASRSPVFDVVFNYLQEQLIPALQDAQASYVPIKGQALQMDLVLIATHEGPNMKFVLSYSRKLYDDAVVENFMEQFLTTLERCCDDDGNALLMDLCELPKRQYDQIVRDFPGECVQSWQGSTIISLFRKQAAKTPENRAVVFKGDSLTYSQLDDITNRLAAHLISLGAGRGSVVGVMVNRGMMMPIGALSGGGKRVVAYVVSDAPVDIKAMNAFIEEELPAYMVPAATMQIERIPLNQNGKVNRRELPRIQIQAEESIPPRTEMEQAIFDVVAGILKMEDFGVTTDLMYAGLNSLSAIKAAALITEKTGKNLRTMELMREKTIEKITVLLGSSTSYEAKSYEKREYYPLTQNQLGLYFACIKDPSTLVYNIPFEITFSPDTDTEKLLKSVRRVINANPYVKTHFALRDNEPVQLRQDELEIDIPLNTYTSEEYAAKKSAFVRPFSFFEGPLLRMEICILADSVRLLCDFHHMIFDGGSMDIFLQDLSAAYDGTALQAESFSSFDLALLEQENAQGEAFDQAKVFFHERLSDGEGATVFPTDNPSGGTGTPRTVHAKISKSSVEDAIKGQSVTASNLFLAATALVSGRFASTRDVRIAAITNGREGVHVQRNIGMLVKTLPITLKLHPADSASAYLRGVQQEMTDVLAHQTYPYLQASSDYGYNAQMLYAYQGGVVSNYTVGGDALILAPLGLNRAKFPISINIQEDGQSFIVEAEYDDSLYTEATMRTLAECIAHTAGQLACRSEATIGSLSICTDEQRAVVESFNRKIDGIPVGALHQRFEAWALRTPNRTALIAVDATLSFDELNRRANALANSLLALGVQPEDRIAFMLPRDSRILVCMLGILKAGCAYIPVDPDYPLDRITHVLEDSGARYILTKKGSSLANSLNVDDLLQNDNTANPNLPVNRDQLCYIIYTSGSTGKPKGVMLTHGGIINYVLDDPQNRHVHALVENQCMMASVTTVSFDMFLKEAFTTLMNGLTLVLADDEQAKNPDKLAALFAKTGANAFNATPSRMLQYMELPEMKQALAQCKVIMAGGEGYPPALYKKLREITNAVLINTYGPTEITVSSNGKLLDSEFITIGAPLKGVVEEVMDIEGNPLPVGFTGELWIGGNGVARGYFGNPEMTAERFITQNGMRWYKSGDVARWTEDGEVIILGRNDGQIKLRGLRIELGEIENAISAVPGIGRCTVLVRKLHGQEHLCAYYTASHDIPAQELREILLSSLTKYMVPTAYLQMDRLPMTPNGKIDRKALPDAQLMQRQEYEPPCSEDEQIYCDIFASILHLNRVGATDNFFDMGGTSLLVTQLTIDAAAKGKTLSYGDVFAYPTPRELAALGSAPTAKADENSLADYDYNAIHALLKENTLDALRSGEMYELGNVCITGATGFLGIHVLRAFLQMEKGTAFCVVRGRKTLSAEKRLRSMLAYYYGGAMLPIHGRPFLDVLDELMGSRIVVIDGSITDPELYEALDALPIDTYINCAANVKHFSAGTDIEDVNYGGVKLALAFCKRKHCRFVQVSTASIAGMSVNGEPLETTRLDERMLYFGQDLSNKYAGSKFLAERAILEAATDGLDVKIMRVGNLMARDADGEFQANFRTNNFLSRLKAYHLVGAIPYEAMGMSTEFAPIDSTALAVLLLSKTPKACRVFHPYNDHDVFLGDAVAALTRQGIVIEPCEACEYERRLGEAMRDPRKAKQLNALIAYQEHGKRIVPIKSVNSYTSQVLLRLDFMWPITSEAYLKQFFVMMDGLRFFDSESADSERR